MSINWCPVVRPTSKEFKNFYQYMEYLDKTYRKDYGMVKVRPLDLPEASTPRA
jgi:hypothetical protein